jgi:viroplasmin and RNaseH domain-containing protein
MLKLYSKETDKEIQVWCSDVEAIQKWDRQGNTSVVFRCWSYTEMRQTRKYKCGVQMMKLYRNETDKEIQVWCSDVETIQKWDRQGNTSVVFRCWNYTEMRQTRKYKCGVQMLKLYRNETDKEIQVWCSDVEAIQKWDRQGDTSVVFRCWNYTEMRQTRKY